MSDHDAARGPLDKAYAQAEAMLDDDAARAARRARVLNAIAREAPIEPLSRPRPSRRLGGWLAAAGVAGVTSLFALQLSPPLAPTQPPAQEAAVTLEPVPAAEMASAPAPETASPAPTSPTAAPVQVQAPAAFPAAPQNEARSSRRAAEVPPAPTAPPPAPASPFPMAPPPAAPESQDMAEGVVMGRGAAAPPPMAQARSSPSISASVEAKVSASPAVIAARLRSAAAAGRTAEVTALLAQGGRVDAPDERGETALMKAIQSNHPRAAALLRRHGASLDRENDAGVTARDMATSIGDPVLSRAVGLAP